MLLAAALRSVRAGAPHTLAAATSAALPRHAQRRVRMSTLAEGEPTFNQSTQLYFEEAATFTKWSPGVLEELKEVDTMISFKVGREAEESQWRWR